MKRKREKEAKAKDKAVAKAEDEDENDEMYWYEGEEEEGFENDEEYPDTLLDEEWEGAGDETDWYDEDRMNRAPLDI